MELEPRPHSGRRRNEATGQAILDASHELLLEAGPRGLTFEAVARRARVGKQTIYRWWPSRGALLLEATAERARQDIPIPDTGTLTGDVEAFLVATFTAAVPERAAVLRALAAEAQLDPEMAAPFAGFIAQRRAALATLLDRGADRGELPADADRTLLVDAAFGMLWYRLLIHPGPLDAAAARAVTRLILSPG